MNDEESRSVSRRKVAKGAAWAAPVVVAASQVPAYAVSTKCPTQRCLFPLAGLAVSTSLVTRNVGSLAIGPVEFGVAMTCSGVISVGVATVHGARLTMSDGQTYAASSLAVGAAVGVLGATAAGLTGLFRFSGVTFPSGTYISVAGVDTSPVRPERLCVDVTVPFSIGIGGTNSVDCEQRQTVCYKPTFVSATVGVVGALTGAGNVTYTTTWVADTSS